MEEDSSVSTLWASCWSKGITSAKFATTAANRHLCGGEKVWPVLAWTITRQTINENDDDDDDDDDDLRHNYVDSMCNQALTTTICIPFWRKKMRKLPKMWMLLILQIILK